MSDGAKVRLVADVMTSDPLTAEPSETVAEATARMRDRKVGSVVVVDGRRAIGILTERDLVKIIPKEKWITFPLQLIYHGRTLCFARKPRCAECKLEPLCYAPDKTV